MTQRRPGNPNWRRGGTSPNPGGRPRVVADIQTLARQHAPAAVQALVEALSDPKTKVPAAVAILDRAYGRAQQAVSLGGPEGSKVEWSFTWADATLPEPPRAADEGNEAT